MPQNPDVLLNEACSLFMASLKEDQRHVCYQDVNRFIQWCGRHTTLKQLNPQIVAAYAEWVGASGGNTLNKLGPVKSFLSYIKQKGLIAANLSPHVRAPQTRTRGRSKTSNKPPVEQVQLTEEGYQELTSRLSGLKVERTKIVSDIRKAMADKDFRENAPLDAAKERQGFIESLIRELESTLSYAVIVGSDTSNHNFQVSLGKKVTLKDVTRDREITFILVHSTEADPATGKISDISPVGKALLHRKVGEEVSITVPNGTLLYSIERIES